MTQKCLKSTKKVENGQKMYLDWLSDACNTQKLVQIHNNNEPHQINQAGGIDDGYSLIWMRFSTLVFLLCCLVQKDNKLFKTKLVCLFLLIKTYPKEKRGAAAVYKRTEGWMDGKAVLLIAHRNQLTRPVKTLFKCCTGCLGIALIFFKHQKIFNFRMHKTIIRWSFENLALAVSTFGT